VATNTMFTGAVRHIYGMARDGQVPWAPTFSKTLKDGSPWTAVLLLGIGSLIPVYVFTTKTASIVGGATAAMYLAYFLVLTVVLIYRLRGWPKVRGWFALGGWGILVNLVAVLGTGLTFFNLMWPRVSTNPTLNQVAGTTGGGFWRDIPLAWLVIAFPLAVGIVFYAFRHKQIHEHPLAIDAFEPEP